MGPKKNSKIILILIISIIVLILLTGLAFAYFATDMFKSDKDMFLKYVAQMGIDSKIEQYFEKKKTTPYKNEGTITPYISNASDTVNNFNISFSGQFDTINNNFSQDISLNYSSDVNFPISIKNVENTFGLQSKYIGSKYIAQELDNIENETLKPLNKVQELGDTQFSKEELKQLQETYLSVITNELQDSQFSKENNSYKLTINGEQIKNIISKVLDTLKNDQKTLDKINEKFSINLTPSNIDNYRKTIEEEISENDQNYEITIFQEKGKANKLEITTKEIIITIEKNQEEDAIQYKISFKGNETSDEISISANYTGLSGLQSVNEEYTFDMSIEPILDNGILTKAQASQSTSQIEENDYEEETNTTNNTSNILTAKYQINNKINFIESAQIEEFTDSNTMFLNNFEEEQVDNFLDQVGQRIQKINKEQMEQLGLEEYENPIIQMFTMTFLGGFVSNQASDVINNTNLSEAEINAFNSKFENYESTNLRGTTVRGLLSTIQTNNAAQDDNKKIKEIHFDGEEYEVTDQNISALKDSVDLEKTYRVEFERDEETGIIYRAVINKK